ncbi:Hypothetical protein CINCED_3A007328, partial [Cinara cedri]
HGTRVYHHFLKYLAQKTNGQDEKKNPDKDQKQWKNCKIWIENVSKLPFVGKNVMLIGEQYINAYYYMKDCDTMIRDYNAFYDFFMDKYKDINPDTKYNNLRQSCDMFLRLNSQYRFMDKLSN